MKIFMIADDSPVIRKVAKRIIEDLGFIVVEAADGLQAQALCADNMPDGILVDWDMPGMDGLELIQWLAAYPKAEKLKVLFCTSEVNVPLMTRAKRAGADGFLLKPFNRHMIASKFGEVGLLEEPPVAA
ncbi:MAG: response regulator [Phyllobacteriaceae bacterium]|nr:response regulator [Phyllobacteriaceae bacterium]